MSSREREKCLDVLGLPHSSTEDDIKKAYRRLAKQYHPDKNTEDGAKEQFQEISYAYKYLVEGPAAVGVEDDEDEGIPIEVLIRLFPWMFGGTRFHPFYHDPFEYYPGMYEDSSDDYDYDDYSPHVNGFNFKPSSTYTPGPSKEERKKEKKKKAKERRKAAKMTKAQASQAPGGETKQTKETPSSEKVVKDDKIQQENNNNSNVTETKSKDHKEKDKTSENQNISGPSSTPTGPDAPQTPSKKSKKKLKQEQKKREREMELIANEFKQKQKEQAEKEAKKEEMRKEKEKMEEIRREETRKKELEEIARREEKRKEELLRREKEKKESGRSARAESADDSIFPKGGNSESTRTVSMSESEGGRIENVDDVSDVDDGSANDSYHDDKSATHQGYSAAQEFGRDSNGRYNSTQCVRPKVTHPSRSEVDHERPRSRCKTQYKDTRSSSRGSERSSASSQPDRQTYMSKKIKRNGRKKQVEADDWSGEESVAPFDSLMPQSEAEEMRMFHEAIIMSQRDAKQQGVIPETEEEERRMLEAALRESQRTAQWGGLDTLDDVSDYEDGAQYGADSASCAGAGLGDWHQSIGQNSYRHNKENVAPNLGLADTSFKLGGLGATSSSYRASGAQDMGTGSNGSAGQSEKFDKAVGGKVKGKDKSKTKKNTSGSWEFGGGAKPVHTANVEGLQFGLVDFGCVSDEDESHIPAWAREDTAPYNQYSNQSSHEDLYDERYGGSSKHNPQPQPGVRQTSTNSYRNQAGQTSGISSSKSSPAATHVTTAGLGDMDDIDDVDTFEDSSMPSFGSSAEPTSSFDLNIPAAFSNKKIKSYYQRKT